VDVDIIYRVIEMAEQRLGRGQYAKGLGHSTAQNRLE